MKYMIILSLVLLSGCKNWMDEEPKKTYTARACNRDGCTVLSRFADEFECRSFNKAIVNLHKLMKDKPSKILGCQEDL